MVPDELVHKVVADRLSWHDWNFGFVLDGFPRNFTQVEFLMENYNLNAVIHMEAPDSLVTERILARRACSQCGLDYNLIGHRPKIEGVCDVCGGNLVVRSDDHEEAIKHRIQDYHAKTEPMIQFFKRMGILHTVDATLTVEKVNLAITKTLGLPKKPQPLNSTNQLATLESNHPSSGKAGP
jgi:adenylate kinase